MAEGFNGVVSVDARFEVVDDTEDWIVVSKSAPLIVHPTSGKSEPTLLGGVESLLSYDMVNGARLSIVNRLDRETSGLVLIAKNSTAARFFGRAMERRQIHKEYDAFCDGWPEWEHKVVHAPILRKGEVEPSPIWLKQMVHPRGRPCETLFEVKERFEVGGRKVSRLRVFPKTGRMHQIRVHAQHLGFPLVGDKIYGPDEAYYLQYIEGDWSRNMQEDLMLPRHALHAARMRLMDGDEFQWSIGLPKDLAVFLRAGKWVP